MAGNNTKHTNLINHKERKEHSMKSIVQFAALLIVTLTLAGCASSGMVRGASPITVAKPFELDLIFVKTSSSLGDLEAEKQMLNDKIVSGLKERHIFNAVSGNRAELGSGSGITISADIKEIRKISKEQRQWGGAMAGRARIRIQVTVSDLNSGGRIETFEAEGVSSGGSDLAGTTDEAVERAAAEVVGQVLRINALTAE